MNENDWFKSRSIFPTRSYRQVGSGCSSWDSSASSLESASLGDLPRPVDRLPEVDEEPLDREWHQFLSLWDHHDLRKLVARSIPDMVVIIWQEEFTSLGESSSVHQGIDPIKRAQQKTNTRADGEATTATIKLVEGVISRTKISTAAFLLALFLVYRYRCIPKSEYGDPGSQYRMFLIGLILAHKYTEDYPFCNKVWAKLTCFNTQHINDMERDFLHRIDHRLMVDFGEFQQWVVCLDTRFGWTAKALGRENYRNRPLPPTPTSLNDNVDGYGDDGGAQVKLSQNASRHVTVEARRSNRNNSTFTSL